MDGTTALLNANETNARFKHGTLSFYPSGEGIWHDNIRQISHDNESLLKAGERLANILNCPDFANPEAASDWFRKSWISQSHCYDADFFIFSLISQAGYVTQQKTEIDRLIIKANLKNRDGSPWHDLKNKLATDPVKSALSQMGIGSIKINSETIIIDQHSTKTIQITSEKIPHEHYSLF
jgi:hypothetical protein